MPQLLLELFSEEIPARMQAQAARDLARLATDGFAKHELQPESVRAFAGPRRLTLAVEGLPAATPDRVEELKGPKASAPPQALEGFLKKAGVAREALVERDGVLFATLSRAGRPTPEIAAEVVGAIVRGFPWPKSMRSGASSFRWVRPLKRVLFLFDGAVVPFEIDGIVSGDLTEGHRFLGERPGEPFAVRDFADYEAKLAAAFVVLDPAERRQRIADRAAAVCAAEGLELAADEGLLEEVAGLAEWPVPVLGAMDPAFLDLPGEVIRTSMRTHQKYFAVRRPGETALAPRFVVVANVEAADGGAEIARGNAKVLSARLADARFFWDEDRKPGAFDRWAEKLGGVTFHAKLGTMAERVERIAVLAREIAPAVGADPKLAETAARLAKLDLASAMVGEFPELQGVMGGYYARMAPYSARALPLEGGGLGGGVGSRSETGLGDVSADHTHPAAHTPIPGPSPLEGEGRASAAELLRVAEADGEEDPLSGVDSAPATGAGWWAGLSRDDVDAVADAVRDHYKPVGPSDTVPLARVTVAVALADKLDTLVGFFAIDEKPTGSKDPYALRRAALGVIRLVLENGVRLHLRSTSSAPLLFAQVHANVAQQRYIKAAKEFDPYAEPMKGSAALMQLAREAIILGEQITHHRPLETYQGAILNTLSAFFADRLKVQLRDEDERHDLVDAVFALGDDDLVRIGARVEALSGFLATEDGANLLAGYKRAVNILRAEAKKHPEEAVAPLPLEGGEVGRGGDSAEVSATGASASGVGAVTPIPGPSPIKGEGGAPEEQVLRAALAGVVAELEPRLAREDFAGAMSALARLRAPVDAFFERVLVNDPDPAVRLNRLRLLATIRDAANRVADFSLISG